MTTRASHTGNVPPIARPITSPPVKTPSTTGSSPPPNIEGLANRRAIVPSTRSVTLAMETVTASAPKSPRTAYSSAGAARYARASETWFASPGTNAPTAATKTNQARTNHGTPVAIAHRKPSTRYTTPAPTPVRFRCIADQCGEGEANGARDAGATYGASPG